jgi:hypothetical protein
MKRVFLVTAVATLLVVLLSISVTASAAPLSQTVPGTIASNVPGTVPGTVPGVLNSCAIGYETGTLNAGQTQVLTYTGYDTNGLDVTSALDIAWTVTGSGQLSINAGKTVVIVATTDGGTSTSVTASGAQGATSCSVTFVGAVVPPAPTPTPAPVATVIVAAADVVAAPVKSGATVSIAQPNVTTTVTAPTNDVTIVVPALATAKTVQIEYNPTSIDVATGFVQKAEPTTILKAFEINLYDDKGVAQENVTFINPLTLRVNYTQADLDAAAGDFASLRILQYVTDQWIALNTSIDFVNMELSAVVTHLSYFAIGTAVEEAVVVETVTAEPAAVTHRLTPLMTPPGVGGTAPSPGILLAMALVAVVFISSGAYYLKQTRNTATEE